MPSDAASWSRVIAVQLAWTPIQTLLVPPERTSTTVRMSEVVGDSGTADMGVRHMAGAPPWPLGYESDFIVSYGKGPQARRCAATARRRRCSTSPRIMADHTFLQLKPDPPASRNKQTLRDLLRDDGEIQRLAAVRLGYRNTQHRFPDTRVPLRRNLTASPIPELVHPERPHRRDPP